MTTIDRTITEAITDLLCAMPASSTDPKDREAWEARKQSLLQRLSVHGGAGLTLSQTCPVWCNGEGEVDVDASVIHRLEMPGLGTGAHDNVITLIRCDDYNRTGQVEVTVGRRGDTQVTLEQGIAGARALLVSLEQLAAGEVLADGTIIARRAAHEAARQAKVDVLFAAMTVPPCPTWCTELAGHPYECIEDDETLLRTHSTDTGPGALAALVQDETQHSGVVTLAAPEIDTGSYVVRGRPYTPAQARRLQADLAVLLPQLEAIVGATA